MDKRNETKVKTVHLPFEEQEQTFMEKAKHKIRYWYSFNKQKIPMIFILIGTIFYTAFLDFEVQGTSIKLLSHIDALRYISDSVRNNIAAFLLFTMYLLSLLQLFNSIGFGKKRAPFTLILMTLITAIQVVSAFIYTQTFFLEQAARTDYTITPSAVTAYTVVIIGATLFVIGTVFAWFYVDWKYVKEKE